MLKGKAIFALLLSLVFIFLLSLPLSTACKANTSSEPVLLLAIGVHVEPFGAAPSRLVGGGSTFTGQGILPQDYHDNRFFQRHVADIRTLAEVMGKHGGKLTVQVQSPFSTILAQQGIPLLPELEKSGHEIALHFHEDRHLGPNCESLPVNTWSAVMSEEISYLKQAGATEIRSWSGGNLYEGVLEAAAKAGLDTYSDWKNPRTQTADKTTFGLEPWKPAGGPNPFDMSKFSVNAPDGKVVYIPWGLSSTNRISGFDKGDLEGSFKNIKNNINYSLSKVEPGKVNVFHFVVHPGEVTGNVNQPYASLDQFLAEHIDPLVASGKVKWATYSEIADSYTSGAVAQNTAPATTGDWKSAPGYMTFVINVHDWVNVEDSADTIVRAVNLFDKYGVKGDFYLTAPVLEAYAAKRPDAIKKLKSSGMTISYHIRPPHALYNGFDDRLLGLKVEDLYRTLKEYETYRLDMRTGELDRTKPGGYSYVAQVFGSSPVTVGAPNDDRRLKETALKLYSDMGAKAVVMYHETGTKIDDPFEYVYGMFVRPSDFSITRWSVDGRPDAFWWNFMESPVARQYNPAAQLEKQLAGWNNNRPPFITSLIHENNFYRRGAESWTYYYYPEADKGRPASPPYDLNAEDKSTERPAKESEAIWDAYEKMLARAAATLKVVTSKDLVEMAAGAEQQAPPVSTLPEKLGTVEKDIEYTVVDGEKLTLDIYYPDKAAGPAPLVLFVHGGAWMHGSKEMGKNNPDLTELLSHGYIVASINYRLAPEHKFPAQIEDVKCAVRYLRANASRYGIDVNNIGAMGGSAGGHLVALLGTSDDHDFNSSGGYADQSARVQAVVDYFGPADLTANLGGNNTPVLMQVYGTADRKSPVLIEASPVTYATADDPPFLVLHGDKDPVVPVEQGRLMDQAMDKAGGISDLIIVKNGGHGFVPTGGRIQPGRLEISSIVADFFDKYLKN